MANVLGELFQDIADAIRTKNGNTESMKPNEFPEEILLIETGVDGDEIDDVLDQINGEVIGEALYTVTFADDSGSELCRITAYEQDNCADPISAGVIPTPTKKSTKYYSFPFAGWSLSAGGEVDESALLCVTSDRTVYAVFNSEKIYLASGDCSSPGASVIWTIDPDYVLEISGSGGTGNYYHSSPHGDVTPWNDYQEVITSVIIGEGITGIGMYNFDGCTALSSVTFPSTMRLIMESSFKGCTSLTSVDIPAAVKYIRSRVFYGCTSLATVNFERKTGWTAKKGNETAVNVYSTELSNPAAAATLLVETYVEHGWENTDAA